jgi:integrase/recombinase XerD
VALHVHADRLCQTVAIRPSARGEGDLLAGARSRQARKFAPTARNYAVARLAADVGLRINEACMLDLNDVRWELGRFGKLNVRYGKGSRRKGPKPRLVPLINGADRSLCWFIENVLGLFGIEPSGHGTPLFPSEHKNTDGQHDYGGQIVTVTHLEGVAGRGRRRGR